MGDNLYGLIPEWISAVATSFAAIFACKAAVAAKKSADKQAELVLADIRPVLGLTDVLIGTFPEDYYPLHLRFSNYGKGPAWLYIVNAYENEDQPIKAHIGTPVCVGPGTVGEIKLFLREKNKKYNINLTIFYWDINDDAHYTKIYGHFGWMQPQAAIAPYWTVDCEEIKHNLPDLIKPPGVQHQSGP